MIKILFHIDTLSGGGAEKVLCNLVNHIDQGKFDITVQTVFPENAGQYLVDGIDGFRSPQAFLAYLAELGIDHLPHRSTISNNYKKVDGVYPDWSFSDTEEPHEVLRRKNVARQFLAAFNKEKVALFDKKFDNV